MKINELNEHCTMKRFIQVNLLNLSGRGSGVVMNWFLISRCCLCAC